MPAHTTIGAIDQGYQVAKRVLAAEVWMVRYLGNVVGPISLDLVTRGIEAGKIPAGAEIAHREHQLWRRLVDLYPEVASAAPTPASHVEPPARPAPPTTMISEAPPVTEETPSAVRVEQARHSSTPPPAPPASARMPFEARAYSSPPPRPVPVPASAPPPPPAARRTSARVPVPDELPVVPPPPPVPPAPPPSYRFPEEPVSIPKQGMLAALFG